MTETQQAVLNWLANGETGPSSETMAFWLGFGIRTTRPYLPCDAGDFGRCLGLLSAAPGLRDSLTDMAVLSPHWEALVMRWADIEQQYHDDEQNSRFVRTYHMIDQILKVAA